METNGCLSNLAAAPVALSDLEKKLRELRLDLASAAETWPQTETGASIARRIERPLSALLGYVEHIKQDCERSTPPNAVPAALNALTEKALQEIRSVYAIIDGLMRAADDPAAARSEEHARARIAGVPAAARGARADSSGPRSARMSRLTPREQQVLALITKGASNKVGGHQLGISTRTFEVHRAHIMGKLGARNAADLVRLALGGGSDG